MKFSIIGVLVLSLFFVSCNNDDDSSPGKEENTIIGKWKLIKLNINGIEQTLDVCELQSIVEFKNDNTFKDIFVTTEEGATNCIYDGFGVTGTFTLNENRLVKTTLEVVAIPDGLNNPTFIEEAKGEDEPQTVSFNQGNLVFTEIIEDGSDLITTIYTYTKTTEDFFVEP